MSLPDPLDVAAKGDWPDFIQPLVDRTIAARAANEPVRITRNELAELNRRTDTRHGTSGGIAPFDGDGPFTLFGWPVSIDD
jgi:hypothetical protein